MRSISIFNNKGGVGKTTLSFHLAHILTARGKRVLMVDADPQCNLTLYCLPQTKIIDIWDQEDAYITNFQNATKQSTENQIEALYQQPRSLHFYLKPAQDGVETDTHHDAQPVALRDNLHLVPGRLTFHEFEEELVFNWQGLFSEKPMSVRLATSVRRLASELDTKYHYDYVIIDTSPSLGRLNRLLVSTSDIFLIPCTPDLFSLYGIRNIGGALRQWKEEYYKLTLLLEDYNLKKFPPDSAKFAGYVILNARKRSDSSNSWQLSKAAYRYAQKIPDYIRKHIPDETTASVKDAGPIGGTAIMHSHASMPSVSQQHHVPIWEVPNETNPNDDDYYSVMGSRTAYEATLRKYHDFAEDLETRITEILGDSGQLGA